MKPLKTEKSAVDDSEAYQCPDCLNYFKVVDGFPTPRGFLIVCPHCENELVYDESEIGDAFR